MTNDQWLAFCRAAVEDLRGVFASMPTRVEREPVLGTGVGGDETTRVDGAAEDAIVARLERLHEEEGLEFHLVSEELGERSFGESPELRRRRRPDRRLAEREAQHPVLLGLDRCRRGLGDEGRRLRLRARLRLG